MISREDLALISARARELSIAPDANVSKALAALIAISEHDYPDTLTEVQLERAMTAIPGTYLDVSKYVELALRFVVGLNLLVLDNDPQIPGGTE